MSRVFYSLLVLFLFCSPADARPKTVKDVLKKIEKKKMRVPEVKSSGTSAGRINLKVIKPSERFSLIFPEGTAERAYEEKLNQEIQKLYGLSQRLRSQETKRKIYMRLAKAYSEKAALAERRIQINYDSKLKDFLAGVTSTKPTLNLKPSKKFNLKALELYKFYIKNYPRALDLDQALFFLGYNYMSLGRTTDAIKHYDLLSKKFPKSQFLQEANFSLGDYYFEKENPQKAKSYFLKVANNPRAQLSSLARYKLAWVRRSLQDHQRALQDVIAVIRISQKAGVRNTRIQKFGAEALKDLPVFYAEAGDPKRAFTYFTNLVSRKKAAKALEQLAYFYMDRGDRKQARYIFDQLVSLNPEGQKSFDYQYSLVEMQSATGRDDLYEKELYRWINNFGPGSKWAANNPDKKKVREALQKAELSLRSHVLKVHRQGQERKQRTRLQRAEKGYNIYLSKFKGHKNYDEMSFFFAELLYDLNKYKEAYAQYRKVLNNVKSAYRKKAYLNSILSLEKTLPKEADLRKQVGRTTKVLPLNSNETKFIAEGNSYLADKSNTENRLEIAYKIANIYYSHNYFNEAEGEFKKIIKTYPTSKYAKYSSDLILDIYALKKDYSGLERVGKELLSLGSPGAKSSNSKIKSLVEQSAFKQAEDSAKTDKPEVAAGKFLAFAKKYQKSKLVNKSYYNAGIFYEKAGRLKEALGAYQEARKRSRGKDPLVFKNTTRFSANIYQKLGYLKKAAGLFEEFATAYPKEADSKVYLTSASIIREGFNDTDGMRKLFKRLKGTAKSSEVNLYDYRLAEAHRRKRDFSKASYYYDKFILAGKGEGSLLVKSAYRIAEFHLANNQLGNARAWYRKTEELFKRYKNRGAASATSEAAQAAFFLTNKYFHSYLSVKIAGNPNAQKTALQRKLSMINELNNKLNNVINYDDGSMIVAALARLGQAYQHLVYSISSAPVPSNLNEEQKKQYQQQIETVVTPFRNNALTSYKKSIEKAEALNTYNSHYKTARFELAKLDPDYNRFKIKSVFSDVVAPRASKLSGFSGLVKSIDAKESVVLEKASVALAKNPNDPGALYFLSSYYQKKGYTQAARIFVDKAASGFKSSAEYKDVYGLVNEQDGFPSKAVTFFREAFQADSAFTPGAVNLTRVLVSEGGCKEAIPVFERLTTDSSLASDLKAKIFGNYGECAREMKDFKTAKKYLQKSLELNSSLRPSIANIAALYLVDLKDRKSAQTYIDQYKKLANTKADFDRIKVLEKLL